MADRLAAADRDRLRDRGLLPITEVAGAALFDAALRCPAPVVVLAPLDRAATRSGPVPPVLRALLPAAPRRAAEPADHTDLADRLRALGERERDHLLLGVVRSHVASVLGHRDPSAIDRDEAFTDLGFDSLTAVELRNRLADGTGLRLPASLVFDHPTPAVLVKFLRARLTPDAADVVRLKVAEVEALLSGAALDARAKDEAASRLELIARRWRGSAQPDLDGASDEELFRLVDATGKD
ncbi:hypothetical protein KCV87_33540 [Actinosynnema pretiosum subsp. pretiosum]|uniref:Carrier domain-containing protein n=1 Tax=Actinosynnema pretiosum subsp. pretiosum TaxID=103721 RepID=A0AA45R7W6_9PSEU|nr:hypothetical protein KCV87_33540 [Actinosynnema pretiosum subsp. pretiosum]